MIDQLSVYTENKKGTARKIFSELRKADINVLGFVNNDSGEFGTVRLILSDTQAAYECLTQAGYLCRTGHVLGVELEDNPGALENLLAHIENMNINVEYMYVGYRRENNMPIIVISCEFVDVVGDSLSRAGYTVY